MARRRPAPLAEQVVVVTGATSGLGRATALLLAERGAAVVVGGRSAHELSRLCGELGPRSARGVCDVTDAAAVDALADLAVARFGRIDTWVNNAGVVSYDRADSLPDDELRRVVDVLLMGVVHGTKAALRHMRPADRGTIITVSSSLAYRGVPLNAAYCAGKHAARAWNEALRTELATQGSHVRLAAILPAGIDTPMFERGRTHLGRPPMPFPPVWSPRVYARGIAYLAEHPRRELWLPLSTVAAVWGQRLAPAMLDRFMARFAERLQYRAGDLDPDAPDNMFDHVPGYDRVDGPFRGTIWRQPVSPYAELRLRPRRTLAAAGLAAGGTALAVARRRRVSRPFGDSP